MSADSEAIRMVAVCKARPGQEDEVRGLFLQAVAFSRTEAGCIDYVLHVDRDRPSHFVFYEVWADQAALDGHNGTPQFKALIARLEVLLVEKAELTLLQKIA